MGLRVTENQGDTVAIKSGRSRIFFKERWHLGWTLVVQQRLSADSLGKNSSRMMESQVLKVLSWERVEGCR